MFREPHHSAHNEQNDQDGCEFHTYGLPHPPTSQPEDMMKQTWRADYPIADLIEHPDNPNRGDMNVIRESIEHHGFYGAVLVQKSTGYIIAGNHRTRAAAELGETTVPAIVVDVNDEQARRIMLMDNRARDRSDTDDTILRMILADMDDLAGTGFNDDDLERLNRITAASEADWNHADAWDGMPGYESENRLAAFKVTVYFTDKADVPSFFETIDREVSTRVWWPMPEDDAPSESWKEKVVVVEDVG